MVRKIVGSKDPVLRKPSKPVAKIDRKVINLIKDLTDTLARQKDPEGVGLAAPQVGVNVRIFVMAKGKEIVPVLARELKKKEKRKKGKQGKYNIGNHYAGRNRREWDKKGGDNYR